MIEIQEQKKESYILGKCDFCKWQDTEDFDIGDEERDMACTILENKHHKTGCTKSTVLLEKGSTPLNSFD